MVELIFKDDVYAFVGATNEVPHVLEHVFLDPVNQEALEVDTICIRILFRASIDLCVT
jgi:hypothetical protein